MGVTVTPSEETQMATLPRDATDLYLAPVVLNVDASIEELGAMDADALATYVALVSDRPDYTRADREQALLMAVAHLLDQHGWELSWDPRGIRLDHGDHHLVLGCPPNFAEYLARDRVR
jgi:hypothetical protein